MARYLAVFLVVATLFGCSTYAAQSYSISANNVAADKQEKGKEAKVKDYYPLEIGNKWIYSLETYGEKVGDVVFIVTGKENFNGIECTKVEQGAEINGELKPFLVSCYTKDEKGVYLHREGEINEETKKPKWRSVYDPPLQILSYPLKESKTWEWIGKKINKDWPEQTFTFKVIKEQEVETPAGKFKTYIVQRNLNMYFPFWEIYAYSPDVGLIAHQILNRSVFKLKSFSKP